MWGGLRSPSATAHHTTDASEEGAGPGQIRGPSAALFGQCPSTHVSEPNQKLYLQNSKSRKGGGGGSDLHVRNRKRHGENVSCGTRKITCPRSRKPYRRCCRGSKSAEVSKREAGLRQMRSIMPRGQTLGGVPWRWGRVSLVTIRRGVGAAKLEVSDAWDR